MKLFDWVVYDTPTGTKITYGDYVGFDTWYIKIIHKKLFAGINTNAIGGNYETRC